MKLLLITCDSGVVTEGKLYLLAAGWTRVLVPDKLFTAGVAAMVRFAEDDLAQGTQVSAKVELVDAGGNVVTLSEPGRKEPKRIEVDATADLSERIEDSNEYQSAFVLSFSIQLRPGDYRWQLRVRDSVADWPFRVLTASEVTALRGAGVEERP